SDEFKLRPIIYGGAEAWRVAGVLKARNVPVLVDLNLEPPSTGGFFSGSRRGAEEPPNSPRRFAAESNPAQLEKLGVRFAFASAGMERPELIPAQLRTAMLRGLSKAAALRALTLAPAEILGAGGQLGSIEPGKIANLSLFDGDAFEERTRLKAAVIDGRFYFPSVTPQAGATGRNFAGGGRPPQARTPAAVPAPERKPPGPEPPSKDVVIYNATILTVTNGTIENGSIWIQDGKIKQVGKSVPSPEGARRIDGSGRYIMPGIIDSHSHSAVSGGVNEGAPAISPQVRITDVLDPEDIDLYRALAGGVTTLNILHGSANAIGGQNAVIKIKWTRPVEEMIFPGAPPGMKMALGENPKRSNFSTPGGTPRFPATRMGVENVIRESFTHAREYAKAWDDYRARAARGEKALPPERNLALDTLADVLAGKILVHAHCYRADEISMLLDIADEFGFKIRSLQHVLEGYKVADKIRKHGAGASTFADSWGYKMEAYDGTAYNAALLAKAGVRTAVNSDSDERVRRLYQEAAKTMKYGGLTETQALRMITLDPAWMLGIDNRVGSIEPGKDADLAIFNGHPFSPYARVEMTLINGQVFFNRQRDVDTRVPWKEEFEPERPPARPTDGEEVRP
ncbi:MAG: amidohydrolase family protein, partial [Acidobacteria bacterium]|nr:amidohydrolase family protein [Acidobacteriota bacterium]